MGKAGCHKNGFLRKPADCGVPSSVLKYNENHEEGSEIKWKFDKFENEIFERIEGVIKH